MAVTLPMVIVFCLSAFVLVVLLYMCMRKLRRPPGDRRRHVRYEEMLLPGEPRDDRHKLSYLLLNCGNTTNTEVDYPKFEADVDRDEALIDYRTLHMQAKLTARGLAQTQQARDGIYDSLLKRVVCAYASNTRRCLETAQELLKVGEKYGRHEKKAPRCPNRIVPIDGMSQYGVMKIDEEGRTVNSKVPSQIQLLEDALANIGTNECDLQTLYEQPTGTKLSMRTMMKTYTKPNLFALNRDLTTENKRALQQLKVDNDDDDIVLIVGQSPYINALAVYIADVMGHSLSKRGTLEEVNLGDLDGFIITRQSKTTTNLDFDDQAPDIDEIISSINQ